MYVKVDKNEIKPKTKNDKDSQLPSDVMADTGDSRVMDVYSHFIMRAAFCTTNNDRQKFIERETRLFEYTCDC